MSVNPHIACPPPLFPETTLEFQVIPRRTRLPYAAPKRRAQVRFSVITRTTHPTGRSPTPLFRSAPETTLEFQVIDSLSLSNIRGT